MQKIIKQDLSGNEKEAEAKAQYTWQKDEIAWYFCVIFRDIFKVRFTGERILIGNCETGRKKKYRIEQLECSDPERKLMETYEDEERFFTTKREAVREGRRHNKEKKQKALALFEKDSKRLKKYWEK